MPDIEIFGPVSAGEITAALKDASYADKLTFIRNSKNVTDINGNAQSFVRVSATLAFSRELIADLVKRLTVITGVEISTEMAAWFPQKPAVAPTAEFSYACDGRTHPHEPT